MQLPNTKQWLNSKSNCFNESDTTNWIRPWRMFFWAHIGRWLGELDKGVGLLTVLFGGGKQPTNKQKQLRKNPLLSCIYSLSFCGLGSVFDKLCYHELRNTPWFDARKEQDSSLSRDFASVFPGVKMRYSSLLFEMYSLWAFSSVLIIALVLKSKDLVRKYLS